MSKALFGGATDENVHQRFETLLSEMAKEAEGYRLQSANRLYIQNKFEILADFKKLLETRYQGQFRSVDFAKSKEVAKEINHWIESVTSHKIQELIKPEHLGALTRLVLVNAVYFKGDWQKQFKTEQTQKKPFYIAQNNEKHVDMMHMSDRFHYGEHDDVQVLGLPYKGNEIMMYVLLPKDRYGLAKFESGLTGERLMKMIEQTDMVKVNVELPKFKLEKELDLVGTLKKIGISEAFDANNADFSKINGQRDLYVSAVVHKAFIEVNEEGTEAAAATGVVMMTRSMPMPAAPPVDFIADHPFMFAITRDDHVLFMGRFM